MQITRCPKGHFYDKEKADTCPTCANGGTIDVSEWEEEPLESPPFDPPTYKRDLMFREVGSTVRLEGIASITYDRCMGFLVTSEDENLVRLNGKPLTSGPYLLREDDELTLGKTRVILTRPYMEAYRNE